MLVFIDESGDPGFDVARGASPLFVLAMVILRSGDEADKTRLAIEDLRRHSIHKSEYKFSKCSDSVRDEFFREVVSCPFDIRALVVRKDIIKPPRLYSDREAFYEYFVSNIVSRSTDLTGARVIIDGSGDREFRRRLSAGLRTQTGRIKDVRFKDSAGDLLVQLADMCAGAIARSFRTDREDQSRWRRMIERRIESIVEFR